jgi:hypothetical protein
MTNKQTGCWKCPASYPMDAHICTACGAANANVFMPLIDRLRGCAGDPDLPDTYAAAMLEAANAIEALLNV